jgi:sugar/nucleoside kinase (ribokinase family)
MSHPQVVLIGNVNVDMILGPQEPWPQPGTEVVLPDYEMRVGGQAANSAMALGALGVPHRILANIGDDMFGRWLRDSFGELAADWPVAPRPTTVSVGITHPNGDRTFFTNQGHLELFGPDDVLPRIQDRAPDGSVALLVATFLTPRIMEGFPLILAACKRANYLAALDPGWPPQGWTDQVRGSFFSWLPATDVLLLNDAETRALGGTEDLAAAAALIRKLLPDAATLVVKRGAEGAQAWQGGEAAIYPSPPVVVADSIGAGDIFNAGFLWGRLEGRSLRGSLAAGVELASAAIATRPRAFNAMLAQRSATSASSG